MIGFLRKNFPATVTSETVKKFSLASNNESYVINALQFIGVIDSEGKRTTKGQDAFVLANDKFPKAFGELVRASYNDLFEIRGEDAWTLSKADLTAYFRTTDKTSEIIGSRQAGLFQTFARLAGHEVAASSTVGIQPSKPKPKASPKAAKGPQPGKVEPQKFEDVATGKASRRDMAMTVRIEINLPANRSKETYDNIFKSIRANLIDE